MSTAEKEAGVRLVFADDLTATTFDWMKDQLVEALTVSDQIELDLENVMCVDRSLVELMCGAHRVADSLGKSFTFGSAATVRRIQELSGESGCANTPCRHRTTGCLFRDGSAGTGRMEEE